AGRAEQEAVIRVGEQRSCCGTELGRSPNEPQEGMGVEQKPHSMYSRKSSSGASKSSAMRRILPLALPGWRGSRLGGGKDSNLAMGCGLCSSWVISSFSPGMSDAINSDKRA